MEDDASSSSTEPAMLLSESMSVANLRFGDDQHKIRIDTKAAPSIAATVATEDDDEDPFRHSATTTGEMETRKERHLSAGMISLALQDEHWTLTPPNSPSSHSSRSIKRGSYRYLKGTDMDDTAYDFAIVTRRKKARSGAWESPEEDGVHARVLMQLTENGLDVDVIEGDFTRKTEDGGTDSKYFVLLVRGRHEVVAAYGRKLKFQTWLRTGNTCEVESVVTSDPIVSPADRIQVIDHIIREAARVRASDPHIHSVFPVHDQRVNSYLLKTFIQTRKLEHLSQRFLSNMKEHFGEKVAYYFAYVDFYNKSLFPIAVLGVILTCFRGVMGTVVYMRMMVVWAFLVSVVWSFWFLKSWSRRNSELNYEWENNLQTKEIKYRNPRFHGEDIINPVTGLADRYYPSWRRYPTYGLVVIFMILQISIMMLIIACWITVFEALKVRYPDSGLFSAQWFYILGGGILYGLFVDIVQWNVIVTKAARAFTEWENWKTLEQFEKSMIRKLFLMDFLNYYTWFFLLAFVYVIPGAGDTITNFLNTVLWNDPPNCCFGSYLDNNGHSCRACPASWHVLTYASARCVPCKGMVTFDINHLDLEQLFLTPIIVTQLLNLVIAVLVPWIHRQHHAQRLRATDRRALAFVKKQGPRQIIADMAYRDEHSQLTNQSKARFLENDDTAMEKLNAKARDILFESRQDDYDPYDDYHHASVQFGFVVMFSMLWPLMPMACILVNALKMRGDGFRLCRTTKRPFPRKAGGIGEWKSVMLVLGCTGVVVNIGLVCISTGALEFMSVECSAEITTAMGGDFSQFRFGPDFGCFSLTSRMVMILVTEHIIFTCIWIFWKLRASVPARVQLEMVKREHKFKTKLLNKTARKAHERMMGLGTDASSMGDASSVAARSPRAQQYHPRPYRGPKRSRRASAGAVASTQVPMEQSPFRKSPSWRNVKSTMTSAMASAMGANTDSSSSPATPRGSTRRSSTNRNGSADEREPLLSSKSLARVWEMTKSSSSSSASGSSARKESYGGATGTVNGTAYGNGAKK